jgi:hypothetical protein
MLHRASNLDILFGKTYSSGPVEGSCEHGNEPLGSIKCWETLEWLSDLRLLKDSAPRG